MASYNKIRWLINRLACMSIHEVLFRIKQYFLLLYESKAPNKIDMLCDIEPVFFETKNWIHAPNNVFKSADFYIDKAISIIQGHLPVFQIIIDTNALVQNWNKNFKDNIVAPMTFGKNLNYRDESLVGDIKYLWEPNRHLHLVVLAQAYFLSGNNTFLKAILLHIQTWIDQCPYLSGPNWSSSQEAAIRLINWSITWQLIGGIESDLFQNQKGKIFRSKWIDSIFRHMHFISGFFSKYSSSNNHLISEAAGLFIASNTWPYWTDISDHWRLISQNILFNETEKQIHTDGGTCEQALSYHQFVLDFLILSYLSGNAFGIKFPKQYLLKIERMLEFLATLRDFNSNWPMIGDADDASVVMMSPEPDFCNAKSLLATGAALFKRNDFLFPINNIDQKTYWLVGDSSIFSSKINYKNRLLPRSFESSGYYILGSSIGQKDEIRCLIDCGPLGYLSLAAHGHSDALSIYLSVQGTEFLIDPGTYCYHTRPKWRNFFRGTSAHNTLRIDKLNQSTTGGNFMWTHKAIAHPIHFETSQEIDSFIGQHDGYYRLKDPVIHTRKILFNKSNRIFKITDTVNCIKNHYVERFWHFHEDCNVEIINNCIVAENKGLTMLISSEMSTKTELYYGNNQLPLGWVSRHYDQKVKSFSAVMSNSILGKTDLKTEIILK